MMKNKITNKATGLLIILCFCLCGFALHSCDWESSLIPLVQGSGLLRSGDDTKTPLTKEYIRTRMKETDANKLPSDPNQWYSEMPSYTAPYHAGKISEEALELTLARLNLLRELSGLPPVVMTDEYNESAQYGAALMAITQNYGHGSQPKPADMPQDFYQKGIDGTNMSNVYPQYLLIQSIDGYNLDPGNPGVGHRLWQMSPGLQAVGFGSVPNMDGKRGGMCERVTYTSAPEAPQPFDWKFVSWPSSGIFPLQGSLFGNPASWSVQLNNSHYAKIGDKAGEVAPGEITVYLIRTSDNRTWQFYTGCDTGYFSAGGNTIIFRILEDGKDHPYKSGETYQVQIRGLKDAKGTPVDFAFQTEFFTP